MVACKAVFFLVVPTRLHPSVLAPNKADELQEVITHTKEGTVLTTVTPTGLKYLLKEQVKT